MTEEEAIALAIAFLEQSDSAELKPKYPDLTYDLRSTKFDEDGWLLHFWRISNRVWIEPWRVAVCLDRTTGQAQFRNYGIVQTEDEAIRLAQSFLTELEIYREEFAARSRPERVLPHIEWTFTLRWIKPYEDGWLLNLDASSETAVRDESDSTVYVNQKTGEVNYIRTR